MTDYKDGDQVWVVRGDHIRPGVIKSTSSGRLEVLVDGQLYEWNYGLPDHVYASLEAAAIALRAEALKHQARIEHNIAMARARMPKGWK